MRKTRVRLLACLALALGSHAEANTYVSEQNAKLNRLVPLVKVTVGPDDQYQAAVDTAGATVVYTKKADLVPRLYKMDLATGQEIEFLPASADSQQAAVSPTGLVAFVYYKFNARGDVCYRPLAGSVNDPVTCLKTDEGERSSPFWKSADELGYVIRDIGKPTARIQVQNLKTGDTKTLAEGRLWSPAMLPGGKSLFYIEMTNDGTDGPVGRRLRMKDLQTGSVRTLKFPLPGISGFPAVSDDEAFLYFSHYLSDTNGDGQIDGDDNSVVFRVPIERLTKEPEVFPEQLTSAENNCSFPRPRGADVYLTCAYEGSLDLYRIPATGVVPTSWNAASLSNAHQTARAYEERILLLNTMRYRGATHSAERLLSNHLMADDTTAARYYLQGVKKNAPAKEKSFYALFDLFLDGRELRKAQRTEEITPSYVRAVLALDDRLKASPGPDRLKAIFRGTLRTYIAQSKEAAAQLASVNLAAKAHPLELHYWLELAAWTYPRLGDTKKLDETYRRMLVAKELSEESRIYYAFRFLKGLESLDRAERTARIEKMLAQVEGPVNTLLKSELITLRLIAAKDEIEKKRVYAELDGLMSGSRSDFFLRKALYVRGILNLADAAEFDYMTYVASNWIRYTIQTDTEYSNAREVYINASLDRGYAAFGSGKLDNANGYFYGSLSLTDDLESHSGYLRSMLARGARTTIDERYQDLQNRKFVEDNMKFVRAVLKLADANDMGALEDATELLEAMTQDRDSAMRYLMLGYLYLERLLRTADAYQFNAAFFDKAHRSLMLAYDLGRDNDRIKAAALENLGLLHQRVQNHGLAAKFLQRRRELGFLTDEDKAAHAWLLARSLYYTYQADRAADELGNILDDKKLKLSPETRAPLGERRAFYLQAAGKFEAAAAAYETLLSQGAITGDLNLAKAHLSQGYCHFKRKKGKSAKESFTKAIEHADKLTTVAAGKDRLIAFEPDRIRLVAYGFLAQIGEPGPRLAALESRKRVLLSNKKLLLEWQAALIQNRLQAAVLLEKTDPKAAFTAVREALDEALEMGKAEQFLSRAVYEAGVAYLAHAVAHPELYRNADTEKIKALVDGATNAYDQVKPLPPEVKSRRTKLKSLWATYALTVSRS